MFLGRDIVVNQLLCLGAIARGRGRSTPMGRHKKLIAIGLLSSLVVLVGAWFAQSQAGTNPRSHTYYIAADVVEWDYAPTGTNQITGEAFDQLANVWVGNGPDRIGRVYKKALYREYTDSTFTALKPRPAEWEHLGFLGPLLRAEVGDTIRVVFRNNVTFPASVHPHGVFYDKNSEGAPSADDAPDADKADDAVPPGGMHTYVWPVPERAGPAEGDLNSIFWMYHSHTVEDRDVNAGLMGPMIVSARGTTKRDGTPEG
ncbi:MAG: multicopper oxidase domain-containing protein, partial [Gemmatimonadales bacterium]|nr:multicopper oxidase domain-containing protein [Gemmatimonadales bacterium]